MRDCGARCEGLSRIPGDCRPDDEEKDFAGMLSALATIARDSHGVLGSPGDKVKIEKDLRFAAEFLVDRLPHSCARQHTVTGWKGDEGWAGC